MKIYAIVALVIFPVAGTLFMARAHAQVTGPVSIQRNFLGSGEPGQAGFENAEKVFNNVYFAPQYLPGEPTSASIWARVIDVPCHQTGTEIQCQGYNWSPSMGRGEYLYFRPILVASGGLPVMPQPADKPPPAGGPH